MKKNEELTYKKVKTLSKKNYFIIIFPILISIIVISLIAFYTFNISNPSNKLKRYLENFKYSCNSTICTKVIEDEIFNINYKTGMLVIDGNDYNITIGKSSPKLFIMSNNKVCNYYKDDYEMLTLIDESYTNDRECLKYVENINNAITTYKTVLKNANVDITKIVN